MKGQRGPCQTDSLKIGSPEIVPGVQSKAKSQDVSPCCQATARASAWITQINVSMSLSVSRVRNSWLNLLTSLEFISAFVFWSPLTVLLPFSPGIGGFMVRQRSKTGQGKTKRCLSRKDSTGSLLENPAGKDEGTVRLKFKSKLQFGPWEQGRQCFSFYIQYVGYIWNKGAGRRIKVAGGHLFWRSLKIFMANILDYLE